MIGIKFFLNEVIEMGDVYDGGDEEISLEEEAFMKGWDEAGEEE